MQRQKHRLVRVLDVRLRNETQGSGKCAASPRLLPDNAHRAHGRRHFGFAVDGFRLPVEVGRLCHLLVPMRC